MTVNPPRKRVSLLGHDFVTCNVLGLHVLLNKPMEVEAPFNFLLCYGNTGTQTHTKNYTRSYFSCFFPLRKVALLSFLTPLLMSNALQGLSMHRDFNPGPQ